MLVILKAQLTQNDLSNNNLKKAKEYINEINKLYDSVAKQYPNLKRVTMPRYKVSKDGVILETNLKTAFDITNMKPILSKTPRGVAPSVEAQPLHQSFKDYFYNLAFDI